MTASTNNQNRRVASDRRKFTYTAYSPERRSGIDRRQMNSGKMKLVVA